MRRVCWELERKVIYKHYIITLLYYDVLGKQIFCNFSAIFIKIKNYVELYEIFIYKIYIIFNKSICISSKNKAYFEKKDIIYTYIVSLYVYVIYFGIIG